MLLFVALAACGRRGALEPPPVSSASRAKAVHATSTSTATATSTATQARTPEAEPAVIDPVDARKPRGWAKDDFEDDDRTHDSNAGRTSAAPPATTNKPFVLDWLL